MVSCAEQYRCVTNTALSYKFTTQTLKPRNRVVNLYDSANKHFVRRKQLFIWQNSSTLFSQKTENIQSITNDAISVTTGQCYGHAPFRDKAKCRIVPTATTAK